MNPKELNTTPITMREMTGGSAKPKELSGLKGSDTKGDRGRTTISDKRGTTLRERSDKTSDVKKGKDKVTPTEKSRHYDKTCRELDKGTAQERRAESEARSIRKAAHDVKNEEEMAKKLFGKKRA